MGIGKGNPLSIVGMEGVNEMTAQRKVAYKTLLGIEFGDQCLRAALVSRTGDGTQIKKQIQVPLVLDPLAATPELLGQEIRNTLQQAGIRETRCVICLPLKWLLKHRMELPDLGSDDQRSFIHLHAEREFPFSLGDLSISVSTFTASDGKRYVTILAIPLTYIRALEAACNVAGLRPISITVGVPVPDTVPQDGGLLCVQQREAGIDVTVVGGGGVVTLRWLASGDSDGDQHTSDPDDAVLREIRLTLSELPSPIRESIRTILIQGVEPWRSRFQSALVDRIRPFIPAARIDMTSDGVGSNAPGVLPLFVTLSRILNGQNRLFEFLPPKTGSFQRIVSRISSRGNLFFGGIGAVVVFVAMLAFLWQQMQLAQLESEWSAMKTPVSEIEALQDKVRLFRPWFGDSIPTLNAILTLTEAFPEEGVVWAKAVEIKDGSAISCEGYANGSAELLKVLDRLNQDRRVTQLQVQQVQGRSPTQFRLTLYWTGE